MPLLAPITLDLNGVNFGLLVLQLFLQIIIIRQALMPLDRRHQRINVFVVHY